ncbi:MAG: carbonate dehydratase [Oleispira antarctica]|uniref:Carbonic anhydrase n=1 Tax=Oleispira antarctica RB-8 TaxID=698738 RepID=R4YUA4_OLEAN|nr:carbonate dehydratase [Oleispira antarctica]MBQ0793097.1 carbonate dehydratase [Oleispira antarctica]CCK76474.1 Carbonic anhydrase, carbonate dehydratase [Oleispira antarctica RB-8]
MAKLDRLLASNKEWADKINEENPDFFANLSKQQNPEYLWIGCSDSRVPANQIVGLMPGEVFVHRNVANQVIHSDLNCLSAVQFAVEVLSVKHIIVTGHYGCGGVHAAYDNSRYGLVDNWLSHVKDVQYKHMEELSKLNDADARNRLCELNVMEQVRNLARTTVVRDAWQKGQELVLHGFVYGLHNGLINDLGIDIGSTDDLKAQFKQF